MKCKLISPLLLRGSFDAGLRPLLRFLQRALLGDGALAPKLNALARHPDLVTARLTWAASQAQFIPLDAPGAGAGLAERERLRATVPPKNVAPVHAVGEFHPGESGPDL